MKASRLPLRAAAAAFLACRPSFSAAFRSFSFTLREVQHCFGHGVLLPQRRHQAAGLAVSDYGSVSLALDDRTDAYSSASQ